MAVIVLPTNFQALDELPSNQGRSSRIHKMLSAYNLLSQSVHLDASDECWLLEEMGSFHSTEYLFALKAQQENIPYGILDDCPAFDNLWSYCLQVCAGTLKACEVVCTGAKEKIAFFLDGGRHHAKASEASGFCYVNDCIIGINYCKSFFKRILYVDVDLHHGDGVQDAFYCSDRVFTFSIHRFEKRGFWPNSGALEEEGIGKGRYFNFNAPLREGMRGKAFLDFAKKAISAIVASNVAPEMIMLQMGLDTLIGDPFSCFSYDSEDLADIVAFLKEEIKLPLVVLGGGGYNSIACAKCWTTTIAKVNEIEISQDIPETYEFIDECAPDFTLDLGTTKRKDCNSSEELDRLLCSLNHRLSLIPAALNSK
jgi:acetoin utilization deacetylase AcuC-like enzyme